MATESWGAIRVVGLPIMQRNGGMLGTVTDVCADEDGQVTSLQVRLGWIAGERCMAARDVTLQKDSILTDLSREQLLECPSEGPHGLVGVEVCSNTGEALGRITNIMVEASELTVLALELSNGIVKDWVRGRPIVILQSDGKLGEVGPGTLALEEDAVTVSGREEPSGESPVKAALAATRHPIDWEKVRSTPEEEMRSEMARIVWQRRGAPKEGDGEKQWIDLVSPWAASLKKAAETGDDSSFNDPALLTSDQVEALRPYRVGLEPLDRGVGG